MPNDDQSVEVHVAPPEVGDFVRPIYANAINMNHTPHDFRIVFSQLSIPLEDPPPGERLELTPQAVADIRIPAGVMYALLGVMKDQFDKYLTAYGPPNMNPEGPGR